VIINNDDSNNNNENDAADDDSNGDIRCEAFTTAAAENVFLQTQSKLFKFTRHWGANKMVCSTPVQIEVFCNS
jgi:hypothetical protein